MEIHESPNPSHFRGAYNIDRSHNVGGDIFQAILWVLVGRGRMDDLDGRKVHEGFVEKTSVCDRALDDLQPWMGLRERVAVPGRKVVNDEDIMPRLKIPLGEVRAEAARPTCDKDTHAPINS